MSWILTPLKSGAPANSGYTWNITGLSATTDYAYRAYVIIDGIAYYGETRYGRTCIEPTYPPSGVTTGIAESVGENMFIVSGNTVGYKDGLPLSEYGVLFTQNSFWGTCANLKYENVPNVCREYVTGDTIIPLTYDETLSGLGAGMMTYYRAYAKNGSGVGYGNVCTQMTTSPPITTFDINVNLSWVGAFDSLDGFGGQINLYCDSTLVSTCYYDDYSKMELTSWTVSCDSDYCVDFSLVTAFNDGYNVMPDTCWCFIGDPFYNYNTITPAITEGKSIHFEICGAGGAI